MSAPCQTCLDFWLYLWLAWLLVGVSASRLSVRLMSGAAGFLPAERHEAWQRLAGIALARHAPAPQALLTTDVQAIAAHGNHRQAKA